MCTHGTAVVTGIFNSNELDPSDTLFIFMPLFLFLLFLVMASVASTGISTSATTDNIFRDIEEQRGFRRAGDGVERAQVGSEHGAGDAMLGGDVGDPWHEGVHDYA
ncbi:hypothetical protein Scep_007089 [Stephania cephalantha]|uniref:Uncharacterized protein n=1 Tax=Stephania cephalantha TaxID=152367 RepID=A0AAP0K9E2_9MAGN